MSFVLLTGTIAVFGHEIDWVMNADIRINPSTVGREIDWPLMANSVADYAPDDAILSLSAPVGKGFAATAIVTPPEGGRRRIYVHPTTGEIRGEAGGHNAQGILRWIHRSLIMPTKIGVPIVSSLSVLLAISLATSFVVYKKWWRGFFKPVRLRNMRTFFGDFHRLAGLWSLWFTLLMILTGLWYLVESLGGDAPRPPRLWRTGVEMTAQESAAALPSMLKAAQDANPALRIRHIDFANKGSGAFNFSGQHEAVLVRSRANVVWVTAETGKVDLVTDGRDMNFHQRISEMADPLHFGNFGGVWTKIIWFVFGVVMTFLSVSGVAIYALRLLKAEHSPPTAKNFTAVFLRGVSFYVWPTLGLVVLSFILLIRALI